MAEESSHLYQTTHYQLLAALRRRRPDIAERVSHSQISPFSTRDRYSASSFNGVSHTASSPLAPSADSYLRKKSLRRKVEDMRATLRQNEDSPTSSLHRTSSSASYASVSRFFPSKPVHKRHVDPIESLEEMYSQLNFETDTNLMDRARIQERIASLRSDRPSSSLIREDHTSVSSTTSNFLDAMKDFQDFPLKETVHPPIKAFLYVPKVDDSATQPVLGSRGKMNSLEEAPIQTTQNGIEAVSSPETLSLSYQQKTVEYNSPHHYSFALNGFKTTDNASSSVSQQATNNRRRMNQLSPHFLGGRLSK